MIQLGNAARDSAIIEALEGVLMYVGGVCLLWSAVGRCTGMAHLLLLFQQII